MIDHLLAYATQAAAQAEPLMAPYYVAPSTQNGVAIPGSWRGDVCIPGVFVWAPAQDVTTTDPTTGVVTVTHTPYDTQWRIIISLPQQDAGLSASAACELVADRDKANAGQAFILQSQLSDAQLAALMIAPTFAGSNYPFGAPS